MSVRAARTWQAGLIVAGFLLFFVAFLVVRRGGTTLSTYVSPESGSGYIMVPDRLMWGIFLSLVGLGCLITSISVGVRAVSESVEPTPTDDEEPPS